MVIYMNVRYPFILLLIEPVWNRNILEVTVAGISPSSFNRTSMESKRVCVSVVLSIVDLLIEPVWNRNVLLFRFPQ